MWIARLEPKLKWRERYTPLTTKMSDDESTEREGEYDANHSSHVGLRDETAPCCRWHPPVSTNFTLFKEKSISHFSRKWIFKEKTWRWGHAWQARCHHRQLPSKPLERWKAAPLWENLGHTSKAYFQIYFILMLTNTSWYFCQSWLTSVRAATGWKNMRRPGRKVPTP